ncbi:predicted protein [Culex quinquefasciatus]|uniref:Predicted protein n=1 Tax=Culex quinquefasciatus TaxID=7176 RepID=B0WGL5_CULQU|nr:predicted protein [Culex quinquefasciatus]|eukprot:XP_001847849.1 predicted protein [Culex quinquefasciatus]
MYNCKYCPAEFTHTSNMSRHIRLKAVHGGGKNTLNETVENGFQSDNSNLLSSTVHEPDPLVDPPADEDFEMILPECSQEEEQAIRPELVENNNATPQREVKEPDVAEADELVHPEAILYSEEIELQQEQPSAAEVQPELTAATLGAEQEQAGQ